MNLQGIQTSARINTVLAAAMGVVIVIFLVASIKYVLSGSHEGSAISPGPSTTRARSTCAPSWVERRWPC